MTNHPTILGIDPGSRFMGFAVIRGHELLDYGVHTMRNGRRPYDVMGQARARVLDLIRRHTPSVVAIEEPMLLPTKRAALISAIGQELHERARELGIRVVEFSPMKARKVVMGNPRGTKMETAEALVKRYGELRSLQPKRPARAVLGPSDKDRYWLHMFDALALTAALQSLGEEGDSDHPDRVGGVNSVDGSRWGV